MALSVGDTADMPSYGNRFFGEHDQPMDHQIVPFPISFVQRFWFSFQKLGFSQTSSREIPVKSPNSKLGRCLISWCHCQLAKPPCWCSPAPFFGVTHAQILLAFESWPLEQISCCWLSPGCRVGRSFLVVRLWRKYTLLSQCGPCHS